MPCIAPGTAIEGSIGPLALRAAAPPRHATPELTCHAVLVDHPSAGRGGGTCGFDQQDTRRGGGRGQAAVLRERRHGESARASCVLSSRRLPQTLRSAPPQTPTTSLSCSQKIVVTVDLENNRLYETEQLNFGVSCVNRCGREMVVRRRMIAAGTLGLPECRRPSPARPPAATHPPPAARRCLPTCPLLQPHRPVPLPLQLCHRHQLPVPRPAAEHQRGGHQDGRVCLLSAHLLQALQRQALRGLSLGAGSRARCWGSSLAARQLATIKC